MDSFAPIETPRLRLRCVRQDDATRVSAMMTPAVSRWVATWPVPFTPEMASERIAASRAGVAAAEVLPFAVERRSDGALLGWVGVHRGAAAMRRGMLGYWLGEEHQGQGYMREAAPAAIMAGFDMLELDVIEAAARPENVASLAVLRACGMVPVGEGMFFAPARGRDERCLFFEVTRPAPGSLS